MCALRDLRDLAGAQRALRLRARRGVGGLRPPRDGRARPAGPARGLRHHGRADQPQRRRPGQGRADGPPRRLRPCRPRLHAVAGGERRPAGHRRLPPHRDHALRRRVDGHVRPAVDQPGAPQRRRRRQQGARPRGDGGRHPLPAGAGAGRDPRADPRDPARGGRPHLHPPAGVRVALEPVRHHAVQRHPPSGAGGRDGRRPRRRLRRHLVPRGGGARGRVRPHGWRPSRPGGVGLHPVARAVPRGAGGLHARRARRSAPSPACGPWTGDSPRWRP